MAGMKPSVNNKNDSTVVNESTPIVNTSDKFMFKFFVLLGPRLLTVITVGPVNEQLVRLVALRIRQKGHVISHYVQ